MQERQLVDAATPAQLAAAVDLHREDIRRLQHHREGDTETGAQCDLPGTEH
jgi:hypothetical protein